MKNPHSLWPSNPTPGPFDKLPDKDEQLRKRRRYDHGTQTLHILDRPEKNGVSLLIVGEKFDADVAVLEDIVRQLQGVIDRFRIKQNPVTRITGDDLR